MCSGVLRRKGSFVSMLQMTQNACVARIRRKVKPTDCRPVKSRGEGAKTEAGEYCAIDANHNLLILTRVDPEWYARQLGVLREHESVVGERAAGRA
jgi:hypothetical protein